MEFTLKQVALFFQSDCLVDKSISGFSVDSRSVKKGDLFFALSGARVDGHLFLKEVAEKGAVGAIVNKSYQGPDYNLFLIFVQDPLSALQEFAANAVKKSSARIVAVTGSVGKTSTKDFITAFLKKKYRVSATPGNNNSQIGLPLAILNHTDGNEDILVLEMGMTHPDQIKNLVQIAPPEVAVITCVSLVHACNFDSILGIAAAKAEIFSHSSTCLGILPKEVVNYENICKQSPCEKKTFSTVDQDADYYLNKQNPNSIHFENKSISIPHLSIPGTHNLHNMLAAIAVARYFSVSWDDIIFTIPTLKLPERRLEFVEKEGIHFINDSYNAAELSMKAALEMMPTPKQKGNKIAVLGSMMDLGKYSIETHTRIGQCALQCADSAFCLGIECEPIYEAFKKAGKPTELFLDRQALVQHLKTILKRDDIVLLKGSSSKQLWKILEEI